MGLNKTKLFKIRAYMSKQKKDDGAIRRMFINRPLEPYLRFLMAWADFAPIFSDLEKDYKKVLNAVLGHLEDSYQLTKFVKKAMEEKAIRFRGVSITAEKNVEALAFAAEEQIVANYKEILKAARCNLDYQDMVNEYIKRIRDTILQTPIISFREPAKEEYGGLILDDRNYDDMLSMIQTQKNGINQIIKGLDYGYVTEVILYLHKESATFNNRLFRDIYDFCSLYDYIPPEQKKLHELNTRPTAKSDYVRAAYNRLRESGRLD